MKLYTTCDLHSDNNVAVLLKNNLMWMSRRILKFIVCALWSVILSATKLAVAQTQYGSPIKVAPFTKPCCVDEIAVLDLNGDGFDDILAASFYWPLQNASIPIQILLNDRHGSFFDGTSQVITGPVPRTVTPRRIVVADFNGDGKADIFIADHGYDASPFPGAQSTLVLSTSDGHYVDATANLPQELAFTHSATASDIDGSGHIALYMGNIWGQQQIGPQLLLNDGTGHFTISSGRLPTAQTDLQQNIYTSSQFVDVNGDGCSDLVLGGDHSTQSVILINDCTGHFSVLPNALPAKLFSDGIAVDIKPIKLGSSGKPDLLFVSTHNSPFYEGRAIQVLINNGDGTFHDGSAQRLGVQEDTGNWIRYAHLSDTNGDCSLDIFSEFSGPYGNEVRIYTNDGTGHFTRQTSGLPSVFGVPHPIDINNTRQISFISTGGDGFYLVPVISGGRCRSLLDFGEDNKTDVAVYQSSTGNWFAVESLTGFFRPAVNFGGPEFLPIPGDYDGDAKPDVAVYQQSAGNWFVVGTTSGFFQVLNFGGSGYLPVPGDYDGDGKTDVAVYQQGTGNWFVVGSTSGFFSPALSFGGSGFIPVPGDYDGDGETDVAVYQQSTGNWFVVGSTQGFFTPALSFGGTGFIPVPGDYDGDGRIDPAVHRSSNGNWFALGSTSGFRQVLNFGGSGFTPVAGDYDGDGKTDAAVYQSSTGNWFVVGTSAGFFSPALSFGGAGFVPVLPQVTILRAMGLL